MSLSFFLLNSLNFSIENHHSESVTPPTGEIYPDPELEPAPEYIPGEFSGLYSGINPQNEDILQLLNSLRNQENGGPPGRRFAGQEKSAPPGVFSRILRTKIHIAAIAIVIYGLFATGNEFVVSGNVFLSLLLWEIAEILILKTYQTRSTFATILYVFSQIPEQYTASAIKIFVTINKVLQDVAVFTFFFVFSHILWQKFILGKDLGMMLEREHFDRI